MKILHTSDWHIGRALYGRKRYEEFEQFLDWLISCIESEGVEALLVAGDVFDNEGLPGVRLPRCQVETVLMMKAYWVYAWGRASKMQT